MNTSSWYYAAIFVGSLSLGFVVVRVSIFLAKGLGVYDEPDAVRKAQTEPIPRLGGVAVALAFSMVAMFIVAISGQTIGNIEIFGFLGTAVLMAALGFLDDQLQIAPSLRLLAQAGIVVLLWFSGTRLLLFGVWWIDLTLLVLFVMVVVNGMNLLDNSDGLAASTAAVIGLGALVIAIYNGQDLVAALAVALVGVSVGFLWHNWRPARVYLGDAGSYFLGFTLAVLVVRLRPSSVASWEGVAIAILLVALPVVDTSFVVIRRMSKGIHPFTAGTDHLSHVLQSRGLSVPSSVSLLQSVSLVGFIGAVSIAVSSRLNGA